MSEKANPPAIRRPTVVSRASKFYPETRKRSVYASHLSSSFKESASIPGLDPVGILTSLFGTTVALKLLSNSYKDLKSSSQGHKKYYKKSKRLKRLGNLYE
jgi:hypothetical protein